MTFIYQIIDAIPFNTNLITRFTTEKLCKQWSVKTYWQQNWWLINKYTNITSLLWKPYKLYCFIYNKSSKQRYLPKCSLKIILSTYFLELLDVISFKYDSLISTYHLNLRNGPPTFSVIRFLTFLRNCY